MARAQRLKETANTADSAERPADASPQAEARLRRFQPYKNVSRETFLSDLAPKPYLTEDSGFTFNHVRSVDFLVQLESGAAGASMGIIVAVSSLRCKIHSCQGLASGRTEPPLGLVRTSIDDTSSFLHWNYGPRIGGNI